MNLIKRIWDSSLGKKYIMAVTGAILLLFVVGHMIGNLQVFLGPEPLNRYAAVLQETVVLVWTVRVLLLVTVVLHVAAAVKLTRENRGARPVGYDRDRFVGATYASRTMLMSGLIVAVFIIYHLLHFTVRVPAVNLTGTTFVGFIDTAEQFDVFKMMVLGFRQPVVSAFYLVGVGLLCLHLRHGIASAAQSLGLRSAGTQRCFEGAAWVIAIGLFVGYSSIPIAILFGYGREVLL